MKKEHFVVATILDFDQVITAVLAKAEKSVNSAALITLTGDLGAGKTTFTQQLAKSLHIAEPVVSPTFGIMKSYELFDQPLYDRLVHIDAYRIEDISEVTPLRFVELFQTPRTLICLEWPENIATVLPLERVTITIEIGMGETRLVQIE